jgi:hypothetical protein
MALEEEHLVAYLTIAQTEENAEAAVKEVRRLMKTSTSHEIFIARHIALQDVQDNKWFMKQVLLSGVFSKSKLDLWFPMHDVVDQRLLKRRFRFLTQSLIPAWFQTPEEMRDALARCLVRWGGDGVSWLWCFFFVALWHVGVAPEVRPEVKPAIVCRLGEARDIISNAGQHKEWASIADAYCCGKNDAALVAQPPSAACQEKEEAQLPPGVE